MNTGVATEIYEKINWVRFGKRTQFWGYFGGFGCRKAKNEPTSGGVRMVATSGALAL